MCQAAVGLCSSFCWDPCSGKGCFGDSWELCFLFDTGSSFSKMTSLGLVYIWGWPLNSTFFRGRSCDSIAEESLCLANSDWTACAKKEAWCPGAGCWALCGMSAQGEGEGSSWNILYLASTPPSHLLSHYLGSVSILPLSREVCLIAGIRWGDLVQLVDTIYVFSIEPIYGLYWSILAGPRGREVHILNAVFFFNLLLNCWEIAHQAHAYAIKTYLGLRIKNAWLLIAKTANNG